MFRCKEGSYEPLLPQRLLRLLACLFKFHQTSR